MDDLIRDPVIYSTRSAFQACRDAEYVDNSALLSMYPSDTTVVQGCGTCRNARSAGMVSRYPVDLGHRETRGPPSGRFDCVIDSFADRPRLTYFKASKGSSVCTVHLADPCLALGPAACSACNAPSTLFWHRVDEQNTSTCG